MNPTDATSAAPTVISAIMAVAVTLGLFFQIVLQLMAKRAAEKKALADAAAAKQAKEDAAAAKIAAEEKAIADAEVARQVSIASSRAQVAAKSAAEAVKDVKDTLVTVTENTSDKLAGLAEVAKASHGLLNASMGVQLLETLDAKTLALHTMQRLLELVSDPTEKAHLQGDIERAKKLVDAAKLLYDEHETRQKIVDNAKDKQP